MKKIFQFAVVAVAATFFTSCEDLQNLADVEFAAPYETVIKVDVPANADSTAGSFVFSDTINLLEISEIEEYKDLIERVSISKMQLTTTNFVGTPGTEFSGTLVVDDAINLTLPVFVITEGATFDITDELDAFTKIGDIVTSSKEMDYSINVDVSETPASFDLNLFIEFEVLANASDSL
jgi:hypothetical protein